MNEIDTILSQIENSKERSALEELRKILHKLLPDAVECISYGMPAFRVGKHCVAGFAKFKNHLSFFPFSGSTLSHFEKELKDAGFTWTKSGVHFTPEKPIPPSLIEQIVAKRLTEEV